MSIALLFNLQTEIRRLSIAGSELSAGDFSLKKLLPPLKKAGESVPIFARIATSLEALIETSSEKASEKLIDLTTLLNAVLYTQCQTDIQGEIEDIECIPVAAKTSASFRKLSPVIEALTTKGSGRLEIITKAFENGDFKDIRLITPTINALDDAYAEISEFVQDKILPSYGESILPFLEKDLNLEGGKLNARKLELLYKIGGTKYNELYIKALDIGSADVKIAAIKAVKDCENAEEILLNLCKDKKKDVRQEAYFSLAEKSTTKGAERLMEAFRGKDFEMAVNPIRQDKSSYMSELIVDEGEKLLAALKPENPSLELLKKLAAILHCTTGRKDSNVFEFLKNTLTQNAYLSTLKIDNEIKAITRVYNISIFSHYVAYTIMLLRTKEAYDFLDSVKDLYKGELITYAFEAAIKGKTAEYVYDNYSPYVGKGKNSIVGQQTIAVLEKLVTFEDRFQKATSRSASNYYDYNYAEDINVEEQSSRKTAWDKRWLDLLMDLKQDEVVFKLANKDNSRCIEYMLTRLKKDQSLTKSRTIHILFGLAQAGYSELNDAIIETLKQTDINRLGYYNYDAMELLKLLPSAYAKAIEEIAASVNYEYVKTNLLEVAEFIKSKSN